MNEWFRENLPWYVNGTLEPEAKAQMEIYLADHAEESTEVEWHRVLREQMKEAWAPQPGEAPGLAKALAKFDEYHRSRRKPGIFERLWKVLAGFGVSPQLVTIGVVAVLAGQAAIIGALLYDKHQVKDDYSNTRALQTEVEAGPFIRVSFRSEATEFDMRMLLIGIGATYVSPPTQLGDYYLYVPPDQLDRALAIAKANPRVLSADKVDKVPAPE